MGVGVWERGGGVYVRRGRGAGAAESEINVLCVRLK